MKVIALLLIYYTAPWPWQQPHHHHKPTPQADCAEINAVVKALGPDRYERAFREATKAQQEIILNCVARP